PPPLLDIHSLLGFQDLRAGLSRPLLRLLLALCAPSPCHDLGMVPNRARKSPLQVCPQLLQPRCLLPSTSVQGMAAEAPFLQDVAKLAVWQVLELIPTG